MEKKKEHGWKICQLKRWELSRFRVLLPSISMVKNAPMSPCIFFIPFIWCPVVYNVKHFFFIHSAKTAQPQKLWIDVLAVLMPLKRDISVSDGCYFWDYSYNYHSCGLKGSWLRGVPFIHSGVEVNSLNRVYRSHSKTSHGEVYEAICLAVLFIGYMTLEKLILLCLPYPVVRWKFISQSLPQ